jgi:hypothetical protein
MDLNHASKLLPWLLGVALVVLAGAVGIAEEEKKADPKAAEKAEKKVAADDDEVLVITNDDLKRMFGEPEETKTDAPAETEAAQAAPGEPGATPAVTAKESDEAAEGGEPTDPLKWMEQRKAAQADWQRQVAEAERAVEKARKRVSDLEYRLRATRIPFLARPEISEKEKEEWASKTAPERAELTQTQLDEARAELAAAEQELARLRTQSP